MNEEFNGVSFADYFKLVNGNFLTIEHTKRYISIFDDNSIEISRVYFSTNIKRGFSLLDLFAIDLKPNDNKYNVMADGYDNKNWLWTYTYIGTVKI
jgi:hypothetical protein